jgi:hypothetical protein
MFPPLVTTVVAAFSLGVGLVVVKGDALALPPSLVVNLPALPLIDSLGLGPDGRAPFNRSRSRGGLALKGPLGSGSGAQLASGNRSLGSISLPWKSIIFPFCVYGLARCESGPELPAGVPGPLVAG